MDPDQKQDVQPVEVEARRIGGQLISGKESNRIKILARCKDAISYIHRGLAKFLVVPLRVR